jgi:hypothetical protein
MTVSFPFTLGIPVPVWLGKDFLARCDASTILMDEYAKLMQNTPICLWPHSVSLKMHKARGSAKRLLSSPRKQQVTGPSTWNVTPKTFVRKSGFEHQKTCIFAHKGCDDPTTFSMINIMVRPGRENLL